MHYLLREVSWPTALLKVETPNERELRFSYACSQHMLPQLPPFQQCSIQSQGVMQTWLHWIR